MTELEEMDRSLRDLLETDVHQLGLSSSVNRVMGDAGVDTVRDLVEQPERALHRWRGLGPSRIGEIKTRLQTVGLILGENPRNYDLERAHRLAHPRRDEAA